MDPRTACPTADALRQLLLGLGDPAQAVELESHVGACPACVERAAGLVCDDEVVRTVRRAALADDTPTAAVVGDLLPLFRRLGRSVRSGTEGATAPWSAGPETTSAAVAERLAPPEQPGELGRLGHYAIHEILGAGGMGVVYRGFDSRLHRPVAVKVVRPELVASSGSAERLLAEARAAAAVESDNIVVVHAVEIHDGVPCIVMPLLRGGTLEARLREAAGPLAHAVVLRLGRELAAGLAAAHARGLIHRDVKPGNVWLEEPGGRAKLLDFGLAAVAGGGECGFAGTPGYMAPEQVRGRGVDARSDLFALGCVLFHAATGRPPFDADSPTGSLVRVVTRDADPAAVANPALPRDLAALIDRLLARDPARRPASAAAVCEELDAIAAEEASARRRAGRRRWLLGVTAAGAACGLGVWFWGRPDPVVVPAAEPEPVRVQILAGPDVGRVIIARKGDEDRVFDPATDTVVSLPPGDYALRPAAAVGKLKLEPESLSVAAGEQRAVRISLVGEFAAATHSQPVTGVAAIAGGERLAILAAGLDRRLTSWAPGEKGEPKSAALTSPAQAFAATPDGAIAVTAGGNKQRPFEFGARLWDGRALKPVGDPLEGHSRLVWSAAVSADGKRVITAAAGEVFLWDAAARTREALAGHKDDAKVFAAAFDPAGARAITGDEDGYLILWDVAARRVLKKLDARSAGETVAVRAVAFTPKGFASAGDDGVIRLWDGVTFEAREVPARQKAVRSLAVSPDGKRLLSGGEDGTVKLWSVADGAPLYTLSGHTGAVNGVCFTPDGAGAASAGADRTVRLWRLPVE